MKSLKYFVLTLAFVSAASQARPIPAPVKVANVLTQADVTAVGQRGEVVRDRHFHPYTNFLISIPVTVLPSNACHTFVGQETTIETASNLPVIRMIGASDPVNDACIDVMPQPVNTNLTFEMKVLTGGFVAADPIQKKVIEIRPMGLHLVTLDMSHSTVTVEALVPQY